jgi:hypothetical protein
MRKKSILFIFYFTVTDQEAVNQASIEMAIQVFFKKENNYEEIKEDMILNYLSNADNPNTA